VEFRGAKVVLMKPLSYSLINYFHRSFISRKMIFHERAPGVRGWPGESEHFFLFFSRFAIVHSHT